MPQPNRSPRRARFSFHSSMMPSTFISLLSTFYSLHLPQISFAAARACPYAIHCQADIPETSSSIRLSRGKYSLLGFRTLQHIRLLTYHLYYSLFLFLSTYRQRDEPDPSRRPSRTTPGIEPTMDWAPTSQCLAGDMLSLFCLCVDPGRFVRRRFSS